MIVSAAFVIYMKALAAMGARRIATGKILLKRDGIRRLIEDIVYHGWGMRYPSPMTPKQIAVAILVVLMTGFTWYTHQSAAPYMQNGELKVGAAIEYWKTRIKAIGPQQAHDEMVREGATIVEKHTLAHTFGEALYTTSDPSSIQYCGAGEYLYGCYHQFIGLTALHEGTSAFSRLQNVCASSANVGGCAHGIGHGLVSARDYSEQSLRAALKDCSDIYDSREFSGTCADGVFMEYNLQEMAALDATGNELRTSRAFSITKATEPCMTIGEFKTECVYELPLWWSFTIATSTPGASARNAELFELCNSIPADVRLRRVCDLGVGFPIAQTHNFSVSAIRTACGAGQTDEERTYCLSGAARRFMENGVPSATVCTDLGLSGGNAKYCESVVHNPRNVMFNVAL